MPSHETPARSAAADAGHGELSGATWRKAVRSGSENGGCVEIAAGLTGLTAIRDSRRPGGVHLVPRAAFAAFLADVKLGAYNLKQE